MSQPPSRILSEKERRAHRRSQNLWIGITFATILVAIIAMFLFGFFYPSNMDSRGFNEPVKVPVTEEQLGRMV